MTETPVPTTTYPPSYRHEFALVAHGRYWASADTVSGLSKFSGWRDWPDSTVVCQHIAPDGRPVTSSPAPFSRQPFDPHGPARCGASVWVIDEGSRWAETSRFFSALGGNGTARDLLGIFDHANRAETWLRDPDAGGDGFRLICDLDAHHAGACGNGPFVWTRREGLSATAPVPA